MALTTTKKETVSLTGVSTVDGTSVIAFTATLSKQNLVVPQVVSNIANKDLYRANLEECRADRNEFEDYAYSIYDELAAEIASEEESDS